MGMCRLGVFFGGLVVSCSIPTGCVLFSSLVLLVFFTSPSIIMHVHISFAGLSISFLSFVSFVASWVFGVVMRFHIFSAVSGLTSAIISDLRFSMCTCTFVFCLRSSYELFHIASWFLCASVSGALFSRSVVFFSFLSSCTAFFENLIPLFVLSLLVLQYWCFFVLSFLPLLALPLILRSWHLSKTLLCLNLRIVLFRYLCRFDLRFFFVSN